MKIHQLSVAEAIQSLHSRPEGLSGAEAARRLQTFGPNQVEKVQGVPLGRRFLSAFTHFFALILWIAAALAFFAERGDPGKGMATLGFAILGVILINGLFSFWQEFRAERAISALRKLIPHEVMASRDGRLERMRAEGLVPGDVILLKEGDDVPADCRVIRSIGARVNLSTLTGESLPMAREEDPSDQEDLIHGKNVLLAGTSLISGEAQAVVFATGMRTEFGRIAHLTQAAKESPSPLQKEMIALSRLLALIAVSLGLVFFFIGRGAGFSFWQGFIFAIGIIVANVPEGLLPTVTLALAMGSQRMAKRNAVIRHLPSVETLGSATVICTDKTGTLTLNRMAAKKLFLWGAIHDPGAMFPSDAGSGEDGLRPFLEGALLCHSLVEAERNGRMELLGDPMEIALVRMARRAIPGRVSYARLGQIPFDSDRKRFSTLHQTPQGRILHTKGALETVLPLCGRVQVGPRVDPLTSEWGQKFLRAQDSMAHEGLRVLALAYRTLTRDEESGRWERNLILSGLVGLEDPPRPEVPGAVQKCREAGIKVIMITGDHPRTAQSIAREIGLVRSASPVVITGDQMRKMSDTQLLLALSVPEILFARVGAEQKMRVVEALKAKGEVVAVTGDGVNDAPALKKADIGIAMGRTGTDVARESADMILLDDNFASIVAAIEEGRAVFENIRKFLAYILTSNIPEIIPYLAFVLFKIPLPLTVLQILAVDLGTDMLPALALGAERPRPDVMGQAPRKKGERLLNPPLIARAYLFLGLMEAAAAMAAFFLVLRGGGWEYGGMPGAEDPLYRQATTACLSAIIVMQGVNVFLCRSERESLWTTGWFGNGLILWGIAFEAVLILIIDYAPVGNYLFGTSPISIEVWLFLLPFAAAMLILEEGRKAWVRRRYKTPHSEPTGRAQDISPHP